MHHIEELDPSNIDDPEIVYGDDNLELVCRRCHGAEHSDERIMLFDENGQPIPPPVKKRRFLKKVHRSPYLGVKKIPKTIT